MLANGRLMKKAMLRANINFAEARFPVAKRCVFNTLLPRNVFTLLQALGRVTNVGYKLSKCTQITATMERQCGDTSFLELTIRGIG